MVEAYLQLLVSVYMNYTQINTHKEYIVGLISKLRVCKPVEYYEFRCTNMANLLK